MFNTIAFPNYPVVVLDLKAPSALLGFQVGGIVGHNFLSRYRVEIDLGLPFRRLSMSEALVEFNSSINQNQLRDYASARALAEKVGIEVEDSWGYGKLIMELFEELVEERIEQPIFITAHPTEVSPLARRNDANPDVTDRFELFVMGKEIANGVSELNDAEDQAERFRQQVAAKKAGDGEAMHYDEDYIIAEEFKRDATSK